MARLSESLLFRMLSVGWPSTLPEIQCHVNKRKTNQRYRAKGFQCFPLRPASPAGLPASPRACGRRGRTRKRTAAPRPSRLAPGRRQKRRPGRCRSAAAEFLSSAVLGTAEPVSVLFPGQGRRGGREEAWGRIAKSPLPCWFHTSFCANSGGLGRFFLFLKNIPEKCQ